MKTRRHNHAVVDMYCVVDTKRSTISFTTHRFDRGYERRPRLEGSWSRDRPGERRGFHRALHRASRRLPRHPSLLFEVRGRLALLRRREKEEQRADWHPARDRGRPEQGGLPAAGAAPGVWKLQVQAPGGCHGDEKWRSVRGQVRGGQPVPRDVWRLESAKGMRFPGGGTYCRPIPLPWCWELRRCLDVGGSVVSSRQI